MHRQRLEVRLRAAGSELGEAVELGVDIQVTAGMGGDEQGPHVEPASLLRAAHQFGEPVGDVHDVHRIDATGVFGGSAAADVSGVTYWGAAATVPRHVPWCARRDHA